MLAPLLTTARELNKATVLVQAVVTDPKQDAQTGSMIAALRFHAPFHGPQTAARMVCKNVLLDDRCWDCPLSAPAFIP